MKIASFFQSPSAKDLKILSDPARSIKWSFEENLLLSSWLMPRMFIVKIKWERDENSFNYVSPVCQIFEALVRSFSIFS